MVCTGNICRSPAGAMLLEDRLGLTATSAGTGALVGRSVEPAMARLLVDDGIDVDGFVARRLTPDMVAGADLVLGMTRAHRSAAVQMVPAALKRSFTLRELARMAEHVAPAQIEEAVGPHASVEERMRALVHIAPRHRTPVGADLDDVADPYRRDDEVFATVYAQIVGCVDVIGRALAPSSA